jgi:hypothetical protein
MTTAGAQLPLASRDRSVRAFGEMLEALAEKNHAALEQQYSANEIDNDEFNRKFVPLFPSADFTERFASIDVTASVPEG